MSIHCKHTALLFYMHCRYRFCQVSTILTRAQWARAGSPKVAVPWRTSGLVRWRHPEILHATDTACFMTRDSHHKYRAPHISTTVYANLSCYQPFSFQWLLLQTIQLSNDPPNNYPALNHRHQPSSFQPFFILTIPLLTFPSVNHPAYNHSLY
jgi:hypothetical protein